MWLSHLDLNSEATSIYLFFFSYNTFLSTILSHDKASPIFKPNVIDGHKQSMLNTHNLNIGTLSTLSST